MRFSVGQRSTPADLFVTKYRRPDPTNLDASKFWVATRTAATPTPLLTPPAERPRLSRIACRSRQHRSEMLAATSDELTQFTSAVPPAAR